MLVQLKKKMLALALSMVMLMGCLAGCGQSTGSPGTSGDATKSTPNNSSSTGKTDILLWMPPFASDDSGALDKEFWVNALEPWATQNNVNLTIEITPWGNYEEKYLTGFSSEQGPDIGYMYLEMLNDFIDMGVLADMSEYITESDRDEYLYLEKGVFKGGQYGMPFIVGNARILYFNMDILNQAGVTELPETWDDLISVATKVKDTNLPGVIPFAGEWADPAIGALNNLYYPYLWQAGGDIYNEDGSKVALMDNDAAVRAAQFMYDLKFKYGVLPDECLAMTGDEVKNQFLAGNVAIASMAASASSNLTDAGINWSFVPSLKDKTMATWIAADQLVLCNTCKNKELAFDLIRYITGAEVMTSFHADLASFPPISKSEPYQDNELFKEMYSDSEYLRTLPVAKGSLQVVDALYRNLQLMMLGDLSPEEAIQKTVDYANSIR